MPLYTQHHTQSLFLCPKGHSSSPGLYSVSHPYPIRTAPYLCTGYDQAIQTCLWTVVVQSDPEPPHPAMTPPNQLHTQLLLKTRECSVQHSPCVQPHPGRPTHTGTTQCTGSVQCTPRDSKERIAPKTRGSPLPQKYTCPRDVAHSKYTGLVLVWYSLVEGVRSMVPDEGSRHVSPDLDYRSRSPAPPADR